MNEQVQDALCLLETAYGVLPKDRKPAGDLVRAHIASLSSVFWAGGEDSPPLGVDVIGIWAAKDEFPPEVELCGIPAAGNPERQWFNQYGPCTPPDRWTHVPTGTWPRHAA